MEAATYIVGGGGNMEVPKGVVLQMTTRGGSKSGSILMYSNFKMRIFGAETNIFTARYRFILCRVHSFNYFRFCALDRVCGQVLFVFFAF